MTYSIKDFWLKHLRTLDRPVAEPHLNGWRANLAPFQAFIEPPLTLHGSEATLANPIWFVSAPGAVGKSTFAKELASKCKAVYVDLAQADTIGGSSLTGALVKNGLYGQWQGDRTTVFLDALDEARLRVTQKSFEDFLGDVLALTKGRSVPAVIFGRSGIVDEAADFLTLHELKCPVFEIGYFPHHDSVEFVMAYLGNLARERNDAALEKRLATHPLIYRETSESFVSQLEEATSQDGRTFSGYAPVLEAIALDLSRVPNPAQLHDETLATQHAQAMLQEITARILDRESTKIRDQLPPDLRAHGAALYKKDEQLSRLSARIYGLPHPRLDLPLAPQLIATYEEVLSPFLATHPFLDGTGARPAGAVFAAAINAFALFSRDDRTLKAVERATGSGPPNPFLFEFYRATAVEKSGEDIIRPEHIVVLYESLTARASADTGTQLSIEAEPDDELADVEILLKASSPGSLPISILLKTTQLGELRFGRAVDSVFVDAPSLDVRIGYGGTVEMIAPIALNIATLTFDCPEVAVTTREGRVEASDNLVLLEAKSLAPSTIIGPPVLRGNAQLAISWPGATSYPWTSFASPTLRRESELQDDALRSLRRLVMAFRSHSRGRLARSAEKIESGRMTKGEVGTQLREKLLRDGILEKSGKMYFLDSSKLGEAAGATFIELKLRQSNDRVRAYVGSL